MLFISASIIVSDAVAKKVEVVSVILFEFLFTTAFASVLALIFEPSWLRYPFTSIRENWLAILAVGFTEGFGLLLSTLGQMYTDSSRAALLFSLDAVYCAALSFFVLHETLSYVELVGCAMMLMAAMISTASADADSELGSEEADDDQMENTDDQVKIGVKEVQLRKMSESEPILGKNSATPISFGSVGSVDFT